MSLSIYHNYFGSSLANRASLQFGQLLRTMEQLSSGLRINRASDGPADLVISEQLRSQSASLNQRIENTTLQIAKYETASGAVGELRSHLTELRSLAVAAANEGGNSESAQQALATQGQNVVNSYNSQVDSAVFNGAALLDGSEGSLADITSLDGIDFSSASSAENSMARIDEAMAELDAVQTDLGSTQKNELEASRAAMQVTHQNLVAAESQIRDADIFATYSSFIGEMLQMKMSLALMAHTNLTSNSVLGLFGSK
jgi:flagellin